MKLRHMLNWLIANNKFIFYTSNSFKRKLFPYKRGVKILFRGKNNTLLIHKNAKFKNCVIDFDCDNAHIELGCGVYHNMKILCKFANNQYLKIGDNFTSLGTTFQLRENFSSVTIGKDCLFSFDTVIWSTDGHAIIKNNEMQAYNTTRPIVIDDKVWVGQGVTICKGTHISSNSVVGISSVVTKSFDEGNVILAGNPAKIVKTGIRWEWENPTMYNELTMVSKKD